MEELIEHTVRVDEHISVQMKIPKELDALALKGLMVKANKLMNLSEVPVAAAKPKKAPYGFWNDELRAELKAMLKKHKIKSRVQQMFADKYKISPVTVRNEFYSRNGFYKG